MKTERLGDLRVISTSSHRELLLPYVVTTRHQSEEEERELEEYQFIATTKTIRNYVEYRARLDWPKHEFHWTKEEDSYNSKPLEGESIRIQLKKGYNPDLPIEAVIFSREKKKDKK